jgi:hypothetical protein
LVYKFIPGAASIRAVARYALVTALPISIGLSILVDLIWRKASKQTPAQRTGITALMTIVILFLLGEQSGRQLTFSKTTEFEKMKVLASRLGSDCDNFYITMRSTPPTYMAEVQGDALAVSMLTGKPTLNGYSGQSPKDWPLWDIGAKDYVINIGVWQQSKGISGKTCALSID